MAGQDSRIRHASGSRFPRSIRHDDLGDSHGPSVNLGLTGTGHKEFESRWDAGNREGPGRQFKKPLPRNS